MDLYTGMLSANDRRSVMAASLEDSLVVASREEWVLFHNRDKFDFVVLYDTSSETYDVTGPLSAFVRAVFDGAFRNFCAIRPCYLQGVFRRGSKCFRMRSSAEFRVERGPHQTTFSRMGSAVPQVRSYLPRRYLTRRAVSPCRVLDWRNPQEPQELRQTT